MRLRRINDPVTFLIKYSIGQESSEEVPFILEDIEQAQDMAHATLRVALKINKEDNGSAEIMSLDGEKLGRMAVLIDESGPLVHEHWIWHEGEKPPLN
tara:strand:+ start:752 stop:1045 length:294 start_codon:yes stop_codon:yes gene_type:complete